MNDALTQDDIDRLLKGESKDELQSDAGVFQAGGAADNSLKRRRKKIKIYDFKRPDKFSKDQIRTLQMLHESFARFVTTSLSAQLRLLVGVHLAAVEQMTYEEFSRSIANPSTLAVVSMDPLQGNAILELDPVVSYIIIDRVFGGKGDVYKIDRELSDVESTVIETFIVRILNNLREAWSTLIDLRPRLSNIETNPQFSQIVPPTEMIVLLTFQIRIGSEEGLINFCLPYLTIEPIIQKLSGQFWYSSGVKQDAEDMNELLLQTNLKEVQTKVYAELGRTSIDLNEALNLAVGDIIRLNGHKINQPITLKVGKKPKFLGEVGVVKNKMTVKIVENLIQDDEN